MLTSITLCKRSLFSLTVLSLVLSLSGAAVAADKGKMDKRGASKGAPLYKRLGGKKAITMVVNDFVGNVAGDNRINGFFAQTAADPKRLESFKKKLTDQICEAAGGPCKYTGQDMKTAHRGMNINDEHFNALVEDLVKALDKNKVGAKEKDELLAALGGMKGMIVGQ